MLLGLAAVWPVYLQHDGRGRRIKLRTVAALGRTPVGALRDTENASSNQPCLALIVLLRAMLAEPQQQRGRLRRASAPEGSSSSLRTVGSAPSPPPGRWGSRHRAGPRCSTGGSWKRWDRLMGPAGNKLSRALLFRRPLSYLV